MTSWLARKLAREPVFFERVAEVLPDWVDLADPDGLNALIEQYNAGLAA